MKMKNTNPSCSRIAELSGISAVTVTNVAPNPMIKLEVAVISPSAGISSVPDVSLPINAPPSSLILHCTPVAAVAPSFLIFAFTLNNPPVIAPISSFGPSTIVIVCGSDQSLSRLPS